MKTIQILGTGCPKCKKLAEAAEIAVRELGIEAVVEKVTDINAIVSFGAMAMPALAIDGVVRVAGRVPAPAEIKQILAAA